MYGRLLFRLFSMTGSRTIRWILTDCPCPIFPPTLTKDPFSLFCSVKLFFLVFQVSRLHPSRPPSNSHLVEPVERSHAIARLLYLHCCDCPPLHILSRVPHGSLPKSFSSCAILSKRGDFRRPPSPLFYQTVSLPLSHLLLLVSSPLDSSPFLR